MSEHGIISEWKCAFGSVLPAGFLCRSALAERWMRIHSLPESKRYPESVRDYSEMLDRQNSVAEYTLGKRSECLLFFTRFGEERELTSDELPFLNAAPEHVMSLNGDDEYHFFALYVTWQREKFNELIVACANDQTGPILFANVATRRIYAPYAGGADLFFPGRSDVEAARSCFSNWLSKRVDGL